MREQSDKWESQWTKLLTHCYGEVEANTAFKTSLLAKLKAKTAEDRSAATASDESTQESDENWSRLLTATYAPCDPNLEFKDTLLSQLKARQTQISTGSRTAAEDEALQTILTKSYHPVTPRREFQTRLLENLKERQRSHTTMKAKTRQRTLVFSSFAGIAAAAMVIFVVWAMPAGTYQGAGAVTAQNTGTPILPLPEATEVMTASIPTETSTMAYADIVPASFEPSAPSFQYNVLDAFAVAALPAVALGRKNIEVNTGDGWRTMETGYPAHVEPGMAFRASEGKVGFIGFDNDTILSMNPGTVVAATPQGFSVTQGFAKVSVPVSSSESFRLHFPERDIAVEPGTDLAVYVETGPDYADGGAPAPVVMVLQEPGASGGFALARGNSGVAPLFSRHLYRLDNYVTPEIPGRPLCDIECEDLEKLYRSESIQEATAPMAAFAGGFAQNRVQRSETRVMTPIGFSKKAERWVADSYIGQETVKIPYLSDSYFGLANDRRDLAHGLSLGANVIIDGGDGVFFEIHK